MNYVYSKEKSHSLRNMIFCLLGLLVLLAGCQYSLETRFLADPGNVEGWWDINWTNRRVLTFDNSGQSENLMEFPILVKLDSGRIDYGKTQNAGQDLRFIDTDGTVLEYEIEEWDESGNSFVWVKIPQIDGSSSADFIWMYYGNTSAADNQNPALLWSNSYLGVWHLAENAAGTGTADLYQDSTGNNDADDEVSATGKDGQIGYGQEFNGIGDVIESSAYLYSFSTQITLSAWFRYTGAGTGSPRIFEISQLGDATSHCLAVDNNASLRAWLEDTTGRSASVDDPIIYDDSAWHNMVYTYSSPNGSLYVDGIETETASDPAANLDDGAYMTIGAVMDATTYNHNEHSYEGFVDEVRISNIERSADWNKAQYDSMTDVFVSFGVEE